MKIVADHPTPEPSIERSAPSRTLPAALGQRPVDLVRPLKVGKLRSFEQLFAHSGTALLLAVDHGNALIALLSTNDPESVGPCAELRARHAVLHAVGPVFDGIVLDPSTGAPQAIICDLVPRNAALLLSADGPPEVCGPHAARSSPLHAAWSASRAHDLGAVGAKFLMYHRPECPDVAARQMRSVTDFVAGCAQRDLVAVVECRTYPLADEPPAAFAARRPDLLLDAVATASRLGADVVAVQWPTRGHGTAASARMYRRIDAAADVPWLLTGTPDADAAEFDRALRLACWAGASGALVGRLLWQDGLARPEDEWSTWLGTVARADALTLRTTIRDCGTPWWRKHGDVPSALGYEG